MADVRCADALGCRNRRRDQHGAFYKIGRAVGAIALLERMGALRTGNDAYAVDPQPKRGYHDADTGKPVPLRDQRHRDAKRSIGDRAQPNSDCAEPTDGDGPQPNSDCAEPTDGDGPRPDTNSPKPTDGDGPQPDTNSPKPTDGDRARPDTNSPKPTNGDCAQPVDDADAYRTEPVSGSQPARGNPERSVGYAVGSGSDPVGSSRALGAERAIAEQ